MLFCGYRWLPTVINFETENSGICPRCRASMVFDELASAVRKTLVKTGLAAATPRTGRRPAMPRFAANLAYLFTERPLIERFAAAAAARLYGGRGAVSLRPRRQRGASRDRKAWPDHAGAQHRARQARGSSGWPRARPRARIRDAVPAGAGLRGGDRRAADPRLAGKVPLKQRPAGEARLHRQSERAADLAAEKGITLLIEPINTRDRPGYYLNRVEHAADIIAKAERSQYPHPVRFLSRADHGRRSHRGGSRRICRSSGMCRWRRCPRVTSRTRAR